MSNAATHGKLAIANAKLAYQNYKHVFSSPRWKLLAAKGATTQRSLWASTSTKNPEYSDVMYVEELLGPETVNAMPEETIRAFQDHGRVANTLQQGLAEGRQLLADLQQLGSSYDEVVTTVEREGVEEFTRSFAQLLETTEEKRLQVTTA